MGAYCQVKVFLPKGEADVYAVSAFYRVFLKFPVSILPEYIGAPICVVLIYICCANDRISITYGD